MEVLPYLSAYLLVYAFALNFIFWWMPAPYGKFSYQKHETCSFVISSYWVSTLSHAGLFSMAIGWFEGDWIWKTDAVMEGRGMLIFILLIIYTVVRVASPLLYCGMQSSENKKFVNPLWLLPYFGFWIPAGFYWRRAVSVIDRPLEAYDYILCIIAVIFWMLNVYSDFSKNRKRYKDDVKEYTVIGKYLSKKQIYEQFTSLERMYHIASLPPNYTFEIAFWFVFIFISWSWEGIWWFCCMFAFLFTRGVWQRTWYDEPVIKQQEQEPLRNNAGDPSDNRYEF